MDPTARPRGFRNHGQTCFLNSVLQALASARPVMLYLEQIVEDRQRMEDLHDRLGLGPSPGPGADAALAGRKRRGLGRGLAWAEGTAISECLLDLLVHANGGSGSGDLPGGGAAATRELLRSVGGEHAQFRAAGRGNAAAARIGTEQQDAQELLQAVMGMMEDEACRARALGGGRASRDPEPSRSEGESDDASVSVVSACSSDDLCGLNSGIPAIKIPLSEEADDIVTLSELLDWMVTVQQEVDFDSVPVDLLPTRKDAQGRDRTQLLPELKSTDPFIRRHRETENAISMGSPLTGWIGSVLKCCACHHVRPIQNTPFLELAIVPTSINSGRSRLARKRGPSSPPPACTLLECLEEFTSVEIVPDVECHNCAIKAELESIDDEIMLLNGAITNVLSRRNATRPRREEDTNDDVEGLTRELERLESRHSFLSSFDPDQDMGDGETGREAFGIGNDVPTPARGDARMSLLISRPPTVLCFHIQRRYYDASSDRMMKAMQLVEFPEVFDLAPFCAYGGGKTSSFAGSDCQVSTHGNSMRCLSTPYKLVSVIEHRGNAHAGHYVSYRRIAPSDWYLVSDERVRDVSWNEVRKAQAYMLVYEAM